MHPDHEPHPVDRERHRRLLTDARRATARQLAGLERTLRELVDAADLEPPDDEHDPDATTAYERAQVTSLAEEARQRLATLDRALAAVDGERFGRCEACGAAIGVERLEAVPDTTRCVACAAGGTVPRPPHR